MLVKAKTDIYYIKWEKLRQFDYTYGKTSFSPAIGVIPWFILEFDLNYDSSNPYLSARMNYDYSYACSFQTKANKSWIFNWRILQSGSTNYNVYTITIYKWPDNGSTSFQVDLNNPTLRMYTYLWEIPGKELKKVFVRKVRPIGDLTTYTTFGKHIDNTRILDENAFTNSDKIKYCKTKGTNHSNSKMLTSYTAIWFWYFTFSGVGNSNSAASVEINGDWVAYSSYSTAYISGIEFFKPGDVINFSGLTYLWLHDYY